MVAIVQGIRLFLVGRIDTLRISGQDEEDRFTSTTIACVALEEAAAAFYPDQRQ